jgi:hypothetical protein
MATAVLIAISPIENPIKPDALFAKSPSLVVSINNPITQIKD